MIYFSLPGAFKFKKVIELFFETPVITLNLRRNAASVGPIVLSSDYKSTMVSQLWFLSIVAPSSLSDV